jgi:hypothetical protein
MRFAGWAFAWLTRGKSTRRAGTGPDVSAVEQPKYTVTHRLHHPEQAQTKCDAEPVHDLNSNLNGPEPFYLDLRRFRNLQAVHGGFRLRIENQPSKLDLPTNIGF